MKNTAKKPTEIFSMCRQKERHSPLKDHGRFTALLGRAAALGRQLLRPGAKWTAGLAAGAALGLMLVFGLGLEGTALAYTIYPLSAYALLVLVLAAVRRMRRLVDCLAQTAPFCALLGDARRRERASLALGTAVSFGYALYRGALGLLYGSAWFGASAAYFLALAGLRTFLMTAGRREGSARQAARRHALTGACLLLLNLAMLGVIVQVVRKNAAQTYPGHLIYASAAFTFYSVIAAAVRRFRRGAGLEEQAVRGVNLVAALFSLLTLQAAMLEQFGGTPDFRMRQNAWLGGVVTLTTTTFGVWMMARGLRALRRAKEAADEF